MPRRATGPLQLLLVLIKSVSAVASESMAVVAVPEDELLLVGQRLPGGVPGAEAGVAERSTGASAWW